jgi:cell division septum initiation protein DivIVA
MSTSEPEAAGDPSGGDPPFRVVLWGYDRGPVDVRVAELVRELADERRRGDQAEQALSRLRQDIGEGQVQGPEEEAGVAADMAIALQQAGLVAARVLAAAGRQVEATITAAGLQAADRLKTAAQQASRLEQQARQLLAEAEMERTGIEAAAARAAQQLRARSDREARAVVAKAREDAELAWREAVRQRQLLQAEAEALATLRQRMLEQLARLLAPLGVVVVDGAGERVLEAAAAPEPRFPAPGLPEA